jgi:hypothetical protein
VYEIYPGQRLQGITDFEGRTVMPGAAPKSLEMEGKPAHVIVRWRFGGPESTTWNGRKLTARTAADGTVSVEFDHRDSSRITWQ